MSKFKSFGQRLNYYRKRKFKNRVFRIMIWWKGYKKIFTAHKPEIDLQQERAIELFRTLTKNKDAELHHSVKAKMRYIKTDFALVTMTGTSHDYMIRLVEKMNSERPNSNEIPIPREHAIEIIEEFDIEMEHRFRALETTIKKIIINDIDKIILKSKQN